MILDSVDGQKLMNVNVGRYLQDGSNKQMLSTFRINFVFIFQLPSAWKIINAALNVILCCC